MRRVLPMHEVERRAILRALDICKGNHAEAARRLRISPATIWRKVKSYKKEK